tara:strand:+ start:1301 stop:1597 length:297 start_codon:yes stop_codon:yes gene_type:complete
MKKTAYIIVPAVVRYDKRLPLGARLLYGEISGLSNMHGFCFASNGYFAKAYGVTDITISNWISKLKQCEYINITYNPHRRIFVPKLDEKKDNTPDTSS